jgi:hypothetical protein
MSQGYVGVSMNAEKRFNQHLKRTQNRHLGFAIKKHGWENLVKSVLLISTKEYCLDIERKLRPADKIGWNLTAGGGHPPSISGPNLQLRGRPPWNKGKTYSAETRAKIRAAVLLKMQDPEHRALLSRIKKGKPSGGKGRKHSDEAIAKMRASKIGVPSKKKGTKLTPEAYEKVVLAARVLWTCPYCSKVGMSKGAANRWHFDACKEKEVT